ncbi:MAG: chemotaxis protein CheC [Candidatus Nanohaloarchaea archaeon]
MGEFELNEKQRDELQELGNIGAGRASKYLSEIVEHKVDVSVPEVEITTLTGPETAKQIFDKPAETEVTAVLMPISHPSGVITFSFTQEDYLKFLKLWGEGSTGDRQNFLETSKEVSDFYLQAIQTLLGIEINESTPRLISLDLNALMIHSSATLSQADSLIINTVLTIKDIECEITLFLELEDIDEVLEALEKQI